MAQSGNEGEKRPVGRPTLYTAEIAEAICLALAEGASLRQACTAPGMPDEVTVRLWVLNDREGFSAQYRAAREMQLERFRDDLVEIADNGTNDWVERERRDGSKEAAFDREHVLRSTLRVHTRQWIMERQAPKTWGPRNTTDFNMNPDPSTLSDASLAAIAAGRGGPSPAPETDEG